MTDWLKLSECFPPMDVSLDEIELLAVTYLTPQEYDHERGKVTRVGLGKLVEFIQEMTDGD